MRQMCYLSVAYQMAPWHRIDIVAKTWTATHSAVSWCLILIAADVLHPLMRLDFVKESGLPHHMPHPTRCPMFCTSKSRHRYPFFATIDLRLIKKIHTRISPALPVVQAGLSGTALIALPAYVRFDRPLFWPGQQAGRKWLDCCAQTNANQMHNGIDETRSTWHVADGSTLICLNDSTQGIGKKREQKERGNLKERNPSESCAKTSLTMTVILAKKKSSIGYSILPAKTKLLNA